MPVDRQTAADFDAAFLDAYTGGDRDQRDDVLKIFLMQSRLLLGRLEGAVGAAKPWADAAHSLKGCARAVGANTLADIAARAEGEGPLHDVRSRTLDEIRLALESTHAQVVAVMRQS